MKYKDLRDFTAQLEQRGELKRISAEIDPALEMTEICDRTLRAGGPALLFERPKGHTVPVLGNLFGTPIISQPQVAILGVGGIEKRPVVVNDAIAIHTMCYLGLSFDHRLIDGAVADQFMANLKSRLENYQA